MKRNIILWGASLLLVLTLSSPSTGPSGAYTGAPGDLDCSNCHSDWQVREKNGSLNIQFENGLTQYLPGETYNITVQVKGSIVNKYGFNLTARRQSDNTFAGQLMAGSGTRVDEPWGRAAYIVHDQVASSSGIWTFQWKAPTTDVVDIVFYASGVAANGNNFFDGDDVYNHSLKISPLITSTNNTDIVTECIYPNPASSHASVQFFIPESDFITAAIYDQQGKLTQTLNGEEFFEQGNHTLQLSLLGLKSGNYQLRLMGPKTWKNYSLIVR